MSAVSILVAVPALLLGLLGDVGAAKPEALDRIVAVVGDKPIFLSEVRRRLRPHFYRIDFGGGDPKDRAAAKASTTRDMIERMIDERLEELEADKAHLSVDGDEIEAGMKQVAAQAKMTVPALLEEAKKQGMTEAEYRQEVRRQVLEGKLIQLRVRARVKVTEADARKAYDAYVKELTGPDAPVDLRILVLSVPKDATDAAKKNAESLAAQLTSQARAGTDFCTLVTKHTDDPTTKSTCGSRGPLPRAGLFPDMAKATAGLKPGEIAAPFLFTDPQGARAYLVIQRAPGAGPPVPAFDSVKDQMMDRAFSEAAEQQRKEWLKELRKRAFIEVKP